MILLSKKKAILSEKENMRNQMQMIRVRVLERVRLELDRPKGLSLHLLTPVLTLQVLASCPGSAEKKI